MEQSWSSGEVADGVELELDHVVLAVTDLTDAARVLHDQFGLASVEGGTHPHWGTANRIIPAGDAYVELVAVVDLDRALANEFGRWIAHAQPGTFRPLGWAVRSVSIEHVAQRLDLDVRSGSRISADGRQLRWRLAGVEEAAAEPSLPFFIQWSADTRHPSRLQGTHPQPREVIVRLELRGDSTRLARWLNDQRLPVVISPGPPSVERIVLQSSAGEIVLGSQ